ncbi:hypothetical protein DERF_013916 [Dermatophagoides farinae]|uniref:Uncharacterized protein n=1 Tax=Dermatophagoides farinae TaxID=6954 RepID=A0A922KW58_DERFA|nr:hypothetical protein DERF_013916 [Dermatophagoides farinae]
MIHNNNNNNNNGTNDLIELIKSKRSLIDTVGHHHNTNQNNNRVINNGNPQGTNLLQKKSYPNHFSFFSSNDFINLRRLLNSLKYKNKSKLDSIQEQSIENSVSSTNGSATGSDETLKKTVKNDNNSQVKTISKKIDLDCDNCENNHHHHHHNHDNRHQSQVVTTLPLPLPSSSSSSSSSTSLVVEEKIQLPIDHEKVILNGHNDKRKKIHPDNSNDDNGEILETLRQVLRMCTKVDVSKRATALDVYQILMNKSELIFKNHNNNRDANDDDDDTEMNNVQINPMDNDNDDDRKD